MTKEDKELLLKDLCARLLYGVKVRLDTGDKAFDTDLVGLPSNNTVNIHNKENYETIEECFIWNIKPYLRPMSSMTEEEGVEWRELLATYPLCAEFNTDNRGWLIAHSDFILSHHFDIWNLIEKGFALEAPEGMYE